MAKATRRGKAKTAYELLQRVCEHITAEPQRYLQTRFVSQGRDLARYGLRPPCGTAACRAGWIVALHAGSIHSRGYHTIETRAGKILGLPCEDTADLFDGAALANEHPRGQTSRIGTRAYALAGVRGLRRFMKEHKAHLQARSLKGV